MNGYTDFPESAGHIFCKFSRDRESVFDVCCPGVSDRDCKQKTRSRLDCGEATWAQVRIVLNTKPTK